MGNAAHFWLDLRPAGDQIDHVSGKRRGGPRQADHLVWTDNNAQLWGLARCECGKFHEGSLRIDLAGLAHARRWCGPPLNPEQVL